MGRNDMIEVEDLEFRHETEMAIIVVDGVRSVGLPKSQIEWPEDASQGDFIAVSMPEWLALDKGLT